MDVAGVGLVMAVEAIAGRLDEEVEVLPVDGVTVVLPNLGLLASEWLAGGVNRRGCGAFPPRCAVRGLRAR